MNKRKVVLYIAASLDGYIARKNGAIDWLAGDGSDPYVDNGYSDFYKTIDTIIMGSKTYEQIIHELSPNMWVYEGKQCFVATTRDFDQNSNVKFVKGNLGALVSALKEQEGKNIWIIGGAEIIEQLVKENLIDEYIISVIPTILGNGIPLFKSGIPEIKLKLKNIRPLDGVVEMYYIKR